jgi:acetoacetyl-CoA reductase
MATPKRIAVVTGGMGGLGEAICIKLAKLGDTVATTYSPGTPRLRNGSSGRKSRAITFTRIPAM